MPNNAVAPNTAGAPAIRLHRVVALLGRFPALAGLDCEVNHGEVVHVQGPNGAGKSTFLRVCAGLVRVQSGEAQVLGVDVVRNPRQVRPRVGLVGHDTMLYDDLTVAENVSFWAQLCGIERDAAQVDAVLDRLAVAELADQRVRTLSAGQRRRCAIASMVVRRPELWLLDEPHAGLDQSGRDLVDGLIADAISAGATVLVASHELERVRPIATRTLTIAGGSAWEPQREVAPAEAAEPPNREDSHG